MALILIGSMAISILVAPVDAQSYTGWKESYAYIGATPNPVAVGEEVLIHLGITEALLNSNNH
jgi:phosphotransferase system IIA component